MQMLSSQPPEIKTGQPHRIFCYGDSLTAGTSPPLDGLFPYGPHLQRALGELMPNSSPAGAGGPDGDNSATAASPMVRWFGSPGWTAVSMAESLDSANGLRSILRSIREKIGSPPSLCVILAGSNDLAYETDAEPIVEALCDLHKASHGEGVPTLAVGVPPSSWQLTSADAANLASDVNAALRRWCEDDGESSSRGMATFVPCPIDRSTLNARNEAEGGLWSPDGLHFSPEGFRALGEGLAPSVAQALSAIDAKGGAV